MKGGKKKCAQKILFSSCQQFPFSSPQTLPQSVPTSISISHLANNLEIVTGFPTPKLARAAPQ